MPMQNVLDSSLANTQEAESRIACKQLNGSVSTPSLLKIYKRLGGGAILLHLFKWVGSGVCRHPLCVF